MKRTVTAVLLGLLLVAVSGCERTEAAAGPGDTVAVTRGRLAVWVIARGKVGARSNITIGPPRHWRLKIEKLVVKEGDQVKKDAILIELDTEDLEENLRDVQRDIRSAEGSHESAEAQLRSERDRLEAEVKRVRQDLAKAEKNLEELRRLPRPTDLRNAEIDLETAGKSAEQTKVRYESMKKLYKTGRGVSLQQLEQRELEYRSAVTQRKRAGLEYELVKAGATQAQCRQAQIQVELAKLDVQMAERTCYLILKQLEQSVRKQDARVAQNMANLSRTKRVIDCCTIRAPVDGTVFYGRIGTHEGLEKIKEGMEVRPWHRLMELPDTTHMQIEIEVEEKDIGKVAVDQEARITLDAYRKRKFSGKVTRIEPVTKRKGGRQRNRQSEPREDVGTKVIDVTVTFDVIPVLTQAGRVRLEANAEGRHEFFKDFFFKATVFDSYDSKPPTGGATRKNDFGVTTSVGWSF